jgi:uncharacterized protein (UPF0332 family)
VTATAVRPRKAQRLLSQAQSLDVADAPEAVAHLADYAMFHAATALLICSGQAVPKTHRGLIGTFGRSPRVWGGDANAHGKALNRAEDLRLLADYGAAASDLAETAAVRADAEQFVTYCRRQIDAADGATFASDEPSSYEYDVVVFERCTEDRPHVLI